MSTKTKKTVARKKGKAKGKRATKGKEKVPSAQDLIRAGLAAGETNEEIRDRVLKVHPDSKIQKNPTGWVGWTIGQERKKGSPWWQEHGKKVAEARGVSLTPDQVPEKATGSRPTATRTRTREKRSKQAK